MSDPGWLLPVAFLSPLLLLLAGALARLRSWLLAVLWLAPLPALVAALLVLQGTPLAFAATRPDLSFALGRPGAILLAAAALLWSLAGIAAWALTERGPAAIRLAGWWLPTLAGSLGVFFAADLLGFYLAYALVSMAAWGLVGHAGTPAARRAAGDYLVFALIGEVCLLMAFVLLAAAMPGTGLALADAVTALTASPWRDTTMTLLILGFGLKIGLAPLHVWMPLAYGAAPLAAAAAIAGAASKAGVIGLIQLLPIVEGLPGWGLILAGLGLSSAFYGLLIGVKQQAPQAVLAYSSVSQLGLTATLLGMGLATAEGLAIAAAVFYATHHLLVKGTLFLLIAAAAASHGHWRWLVLGAAALLGLSLAGLPLTAGVLAKLVLKPILGEGTIGLLASLAAAGTTLLMLHFTLRLAATTGAGAAQVVLASGAGLEGAGRGEAALALPATAPLLPPSGLAGAAPNPRRAVLALAVGAASLAALLLPWVLFPLALGPTPELALGLTAAPAATLAAGPWARLLQAMLATTADGGLWALLWPVLWPLLLGGLVALALWLPPLPPGDLLNLIEAGAVRAARRGGDWIERLDRALSRWPLAGLTLLALVLLFALTLGWSAGG
ncbi:MAG: hypothetical protein EA400_16270 [Chromatiaceae bacterium]|nr:MAG: hypothetical protein EA400_16270 [Chromatiaceae bacterium]